MGRLDRLEDKIMAKILRRANTNSVGVGQGRAGQGQVEKKM